MGVLPLSEILGVRGIDVLGTFPQDVQGYAVMVAGIGTAAVNGRAAQQLIDFLDLAGSRAGDRAGGNGATGK